MVCEVWIEVGTTTDDVLCRGLAAGRNGRNASLLVIARAKAAESDTAVRCAPVRLGVAVCDVAEALDHRTAIGGRRARVTGWCTPARPFCEIAALGTALHVRVAGLAPRATHACTGGAQSRAAIAGDGAGAPRCMAAAWDHDGENEYDSR